MVVCVPNFVVSAVRRRFTLGWKGIYFEVGTDQMLWYYRLDGTRYRVGQDPLWYSEGPNS